VALWLTVAAVKISMRFHSPYDAKILLNQSSNIPNIGSLWL